MIPRAPPSSTDDFGVKAAGDPIPIKDVHATLLRLMGLDDKSLTWLNEGRFKRLTDTGGRVLEEIIA